MDHMKQRIVMNSVEIDYEYVVVDPSNSITVNTKTREHGSQSSRKLKMAPVRFKDGSHFGSRTFRVNKKLQNSINVTINDMKYD